MKFKMMLASIGMAGLAACATTPLPTQAEIDAYDYGPRPTPEQFWSAAEDVARMRLKDPESARFRRSAEIRPGYWQEFLGGRHWGYYSCGWVNARNSFGGYTGESRYVAVWHKGQVLLVDMDDTGDSLVATQCSRSGF